MRGSCSHGAAGCRFGDAAHSGGVFKPGAVVFLEFWEGPCFLKSEIAVDVAGVV